MSLTANVNKGLGSSKKIVLSIDSIEGEDTVRDENLAVPLWFDHASSKVDVSGLSTQHTSEQRNGIEVSVRPAFLGLPGLEDQLEQLSHCVERINRQVEERYQHLAGCVPILLHGATGMTSTSLHMSSLFDIMQAPESLQYSLSWRARPNGRKLFD